MADRISSGLFRFRPVLCGKWLCAAASMYCMFICTGNVSVHIDVSYAVQLLQNIGCDSKERNVYQKIANRRDNILSHFLLHLLRVHLRTESLDFKHSVV